ncbi:MAG: hypothetical protein HY791_26590 [Deltaproteobacteria bacterium]|nr:hypothetical protein [Deltaproteobacteria bacterium]
MGAQDHLGRGVVWFIGSRATEIGVLEQGRESAIEFVGRVSDPIEGPPELLEHLPDDRTMVVTTGEFAGDHVYTYQERNWRKSSTVSDSKEIAYDPTSGHTWVLSHSGLIDDVDDTCEPFQLGLSGPAGDIFSAGGSMWAYGSNRGHLRIIHWRSP